MGIGYDRVNLKFELGQFDVGCWRCHSIEMCTDPRISALLLLGDYISGRGLVAFFASFL
jgi:hypothetical protein